VIADTELRAMRPRIDTVFQPLAKERGSSVGVTSLSDMVRGFQMPPIGLRRRRIPLEHAGVNDRLVQSKRFGLNQPKTQSPQEGFASNMRGFWKAKGDCGLRSGEPILSLAALSPRLTKEEKGQSPLPKTMHRSFPALPTLPAFPPI